MPDAKKRQYDSGPDAVFTFKRDSSAGVNQTVAMSSYTVSASARFMTATTNSFTDRSLTVDSTANTATLAWSSDGGDFSSTGTLELEFELTANGRTERSPNRFTVAVGASLSS